MTPKLYGVGVLLGSVAQSSRSPKFDTPGMFFCDYVHLPVVDES